METRTLLSPTLPGRGLAVSRWTTVLECRLDPGERLPLERFPEERLYLFTDGRGMLDVYPGDVYELRQNTALWTTPMLPTSIWNSGPRPLHWVVFCVGGVPVPELQRLPGAPDGLLTWTSVTSGAHAAPGSGQSTVYVYEGHRHDEGLHLQIRLVPLRRAQRTHDPAELLTLLPGGATQLHTHPDIEETSYILAGEGIAQWDEHEIALHPGDVICYPPGVVRKMTNRGDSTLVYLCHSAGLSE